MTGMTAGTEAHITELMSAIAELAPRKKHRLSPDMVNGKRRLTVLAAEMVIRNLEGCPDVTAPEPAAGAPQQPAPGFPPRLADFKGLVPAGFYATPSRTGNNDLDFWKVKLGKGPKWDGVPFPVRLIGNPGEMRSLDLDPMQKRLALQAITETGIDASQMLYAENVGCCSSCGSPLTDAESRLYGKGPVCRTKKG